MLLPDGITEYSTQRKQRGGRASPCGRSAARFGVGSSSLLRPPPTPGQFLAPKRLPVSICRTPGLTCFQSRDKSTFQTHLRQPCSELWWRAIWFCHFLLSRPWALSLTSSSWSSLTPVGVMHPPHRALEKITHVTHLETCLAPMMHSINVSSHSC